MKKFTKGDRVRLTTVALLINIHETQRSGTVSAKPNSQATNVAVRWDGQKSEARYDFSFIEPIPREDSDAG